MTRRTPKILTGGGCTPIGRCYRWEYDPTTRRFTFRGPGLSVNHQPGKRHPVWKLAADWRRDQNI
jgi:hypothetical protein